MAAAGYEIRVKGHLSDTVTGVLENFTASVTPAETTLRVRSADQAELHGLLEQLQSLGLELIERDSELRLTVAMRETRHCRPDEAWSFRTQSFV